MTCASASASTACCATSTTIPRRMAAGVVSRMKIMAELDIAERRVPQDGRVGLTVDGHRVDLRVVTVPTVRGEGVVMRILDKEAVVHGPRRARHGARRAQPLPSRLHAGARRRARDRPDRLGQVDDALRGARRRSTRRSRTSSRSRTRSSTSSTGITQIQVNPKAGLTFATGLRAMVRADPDVIMVGEIRDRETAQIAIEAALTGHLVLSTLHTNDAATSITRLIEMGIEPFLVASAIDCVVAQRLVRVLCPQCKRRVHPADGDAARVRLRRELRRRGLRAGRLQALRRLGLPRAHRDLRGDDGQRRRSARWRSSAAPPTRSLEMAVVQGMRRLKDDGLEKVKQGRTSMAEVARVVNAGDRRTTSVFASSRPLSCR